VIKDASRFFPVDPDERATILISQILVLPVCPRSSRFVRKACRCSRSAESTRSFPSGPCCSTSSTRSNHRNYRKSDTLQLLRILKTYDLLKTRSLTSCPTGRRQPCGGDSAAES